MVLLLLLFFFFFFLHPRQIYELYALLASLPQLACLAYLWVQFLLLFLKGPKTDEVRGDSSCSFLLISTMKCYITWNISAHCRRLFLFNLKLKCIYTALLSKALYSCLTFTRQWRCQPCKVTTNTSGAVRVRWCLAQGHLGT